MKTAARLFGQSLPGREIAPVAPFSRPAPDLPLLDRPLREHQAEELRRAGYRVVDVAAGAPLPPGCTLLIGADAVFTADTVRALAAEGRRSLVQAAIPPGTALFDFAQPLVGAPDVALPLPLWAGVEGDLEAVAQGHAPPTGLAAVCDETDAVEVRIAPYGPRPHRLRIPSVRRLGGRFAHWLHVLNLNQAALEDACRRYVGTTGLGKASSEIAPTAFVERSILGSGVVVEPQASVMSCFLGDGVRVASHAVLERCVIGHGCHTLIDTHLRRVVAFEGSTLSNIGLTDAVLGEAIFITTGVTFFGGRPGETLPVDGEDTRRPVLGGAVGPRSILGARALFDAGVAVPAGTVIVGRPDEAATGLSDEKLAAAHMCRGRPDQDA